VLDLCAGGGGKTLAMAALADLRLVAHDAEPRRMADLPVRAARAGVEVALAARPEDLAPFDLVYVDAPCSGSGTWRRTPDAKWRLTEARLLELTAVQDSLLDRAAASVAPQGRLAFATCSVLREEGDDRVSALLRRQNGWTIADRMVRDPDNRGDGFFQVVLCRGTGRTRAEP
jgi:16S rRNA (cytosine967-C5)-methyltransferase